MNYSPRKHLVRSSLACEDLMRMGKNMLLTDQIGKGRSTIDDLLVLL